MVTRKRFRRSRSGMTGSKAFELLTGTVAAARITYAGYCADGTRDGRIEDSEFDPDEIERDWEIYGEALTAFWKSGEYTMRETLAPYGIDVKLSPHLFECGGPRAVPWAARFLAPKTKPAKRAKTKPVKRAADL